MLPFPIVDTHLHIWDTGLLPYSWLNDVSALNMSHLAEDFRAASSGVEIEQLVFVQAEVDKTHFVEEAEWVAAQMMADPRIAA